MSQSELKRIFYGSVNIGVKLFYQTHKEFKRQFNNSPFSNALFFFGTFLSLTYLFTFSIAINDVARNQNTIKYSNSILNNNSVTFERHESDLRFYPGSSVVELDSLKYAAGSNTQAFIKDTIAATNRKKLNELVFFIKEYKEKNEVSRFRIILSGHADKT